MENPVSGSLYHAGLFGLGFHRHQRVQAAVVGAGYGELQGADNGFFAAHEQIAELFDHQPADGLRDRKSVV